MHRLLAGLLVGAIAVPSVASMPHSPAIQARTAAAADLVAMRTSLVVCAPSPYGRACPSDYVDIPLSGAQARKATVEVSVYTRQRQGAGPPNPPLDKTPHTLRLVVAGSYYATDAPATLVRTWVGPIRGRQVWKLPSLLPAAGKDQRPYNLYYFSISVDGWPTLHTSTVRVTP
jgi:hypothetical protein